MRTLFVLVGLMMSHGAAERDDDLPTRRRLRVERPLKHRRLVGGGSNGTTLGGITINRPVTIRGAGGRFGQATIRPVNRTTTISTVAAPFVTFDDLASSPADVFGGQRDRLHSSLNHDSRASDSGY